MKKIIALLLAVLMLVSLVACTKAPADTTTKGDSNDTTAAPVADDTTAAPDGEPTGEIVTVSWVTVDGKPTTYDSWVKQVNEYIGPKIGVNVEMQYVDGETLALMYQTGADYDIMFGEGSDRIQDAYNVGAVAPLDDLLVNVPGLTELIPDYVFDAVTIDGQICAIPAYKDYSHSEYWIWEKAIVDQYYPEYTEVCTLQDMYEAVKAIKDAGCDWQSLYMAGSFSNGIPTWNYDTSPVCGFVGINYQGGTEFVSVFEQPDVKENIETIGKLYTEGYFNQDNYVLDSAEMTEYVVGNGWGWPSAAETSWKRDGRDVVVSQYMYTTASTGSIRGSYLFLNSASSEEELIASLKLIEFLNTDTYLRDLFWYGEEGLNWDYITDENGDTKVHRYGEADGVENWTMAAYRQGSFFNVTPQEGSLGYGEIQTLNENAVPSPAMGFVFDKTPVEDIILNMNSIWEQYEKMIMCGVDISLLDTAIAKLYDAGLQTVIDEANAQYTAWLATK